MLMFALLLGTYHQYDTVAYPKTKTWRKTLSGLLTRLGKSLKSAENVELKPLSSHAVKELELKPLSSHEMRRCCLEVYLDGYKKMLVCGNFPQPFNICKLVDDIHHIYSSLYNVISQQSDKVVEKKEGSLPEVSFSFLFSCVCPLYYHFSLLYTGHESLVGVHCGHLTGKLC